MNNAQNQSTVVDTKIPLSFLTDEKVIQFLFRLAFLRYFRQIAQLPILKTYNSTSLFENGEDMKCDCVCT